MEPRLQTLLVQNHLIKAIPLLRRQIEWGNPIWCNSTLNQLEAMSSFRVHGEWCNNFRCFGIYGTFSNNNKSFTIIYNTIWCYILLRNNNGTYRFDDRLLVKMMHYNRKRQDYVCTKWYIDFITLMVDYFERKHKSCVYISVWNSLT